MSVNLLSPGPALPSFDFARDTGLTPGEFRRHLRRASSDFQETVQLERADAFARKRLSDKRYAHTLRVANTAEHLAKRHGLHAKQVRLAALLHDAARQMKKKKLLRLAEEWNLPISDFERLNPKLLHGPVAAEMAKRELGIEDDEVLTAIRVHTAGEPGMSALALVVYVADKIEPARDYPGVERLRRLADRNLRDAAAESIGRGKVRDERRGKQTHPAKLKTLEWLEQCQRREHQGSLIWSGSPLRALSRFSLRPQPGYHPETA